MSHTSTDDNTSTYDSKTRMRKRFVSTSYCGRPRQDRVNHNVPVVFGYIDHSAKRFGQIDLAHL
eukprot:scaffold616637_cov20-Prasinocladus_malaysianus.AAC.1